MNSARLRRIMGILVAAQLICGCSTVLLADAILFQADSFRAELGENAVWNSLIETQSERSLLATDRKTPIAYLQIDGKTYSANLARREGDRLVIAFGGIDTRLEYTIEQADHWVTFRLDRIVGARPQRIAFLRIGVAVTEHVGLRLNGAWDEQTSVVVRGANRQTLCRPIVRAESTELAASAQDVPGPRLEGSAASLFVAPTARLKAVLARYAEAHDLPTNTASDGIASKDTDNARGSYWFLSFAEDEVDQVIECCRKTGFRQVMLNSGVWCTSSGHYLFNATRYPDGVESLKRTVDRFHDAGILVGMHCFASKVSKRDPYVTPAPDRRFLVDRRAVLAEDLSVDSTIDQWPTCKDHIDRTVKRVIACQDDLIPGELGWFGINPADGEYDGLQYDEVEYLMCKSLAYDSPISLQTSFSRMEQHPLNDDILALIKRYEALRHHQYGRIPIARMKRLSDEDLNRLKTPGRDFLVDTDLWDAPMAVEMTRVAMADDDVRVWLGAVGDARLLRLWHGRGRDGELILDANLLSDSFIVTEDLRENGSETFQRHLAKAGKLVLPVDHRYRKFDIRGVPAETLQKALELAKFTVHPSQRIWIQAADFSQSAGTMAKGSAAGVDDPDAIGNFVVCTGKIDRSAANPSYCEYRVQIPKKGLWTLWSRVRYPRGSDMSFGFVPGGEEVTLSGNLVIGNCGVNEAKWHWTGRGGGVTTVPPGSPIRLKLNEGEFTFRIYPREGPGKADTNPRLDVMCLCEDPEDMPTDDEARKALVH